MKRKIQKTIPQISKTNLFVFSVLIIGIISGSIFLILTNTTDKNSIIERITHFFKSISDNSLNNGLALKNSLVINYIFIFSIWIFGLSIIGVIINIFLTYIKGFLVGFSISAIFLTYKYKGILPALLYTFPIQLINIMIIVTLTTNSIYFGINLLKIITSKKPTTNRLMLKKYSKFLMISIILSFISSILEVYLFPKILKLIVPLYI